MKAVFLFLCCLCLMQRVCAQDFPSLKFSHITEKESLSNNDINSITQDKDGFIWVATTDGLNRLDGYRIKKFYHQPDDSTSLVTNNTTQILPDDNNNLWIATVEGISCFNEDQNQFINFSHQQKGKRNLSSDNAKAMFFDNTTKEMWFSIANASCVVDKNLNLKLYNIDKDELPSKLQNLRLVYSGMLQDDQHNLFGYFGGWLFQINKSTKKITRTIDVSKTFIMSAIQDNNNNYWLATFGGGVIEFNLSNEKITPISLDKKQVVVYSICKWKDKNNHEWIVAGTDNGLELIDPQTQHSKFYSNDLLNSNSINAGKVKCLYVDKQNILWIGTETGLSYVEPSKQLIESWQSTVKDEQKIYTEDYAYCFYEDTDVCYASYWNSTGLFIYGKNGDLQKVIDDLYPNHHDSSHIYTTRAYGIIKLKNGNFLFSTDEGLVEYNMQNNRSILHAVDSDYAPSLRTVLQCDDSTFWIRTRNNGPNGIYVYNSNQQKFTGHYYTKTNCKDCLPPNLHDIIITRDKHIYTTPADNYLYVFDKQGNKFIAFFSSAKQTEQLPSKTFDCLAEDANGNLWIGTTNGLFELNPKTKNVINDYSKDKKIGGIAIEALRFDDEQNLWMNTERGLFCLDAKTKQSFNFNTGDGLPTNSLGGFLYKGMNGFMYAGASGNIIKFKPAELLHQHENGDVHINELLVMNHEYPFRFDKNEKQLNLQPGENIFSVDFSVLNYDNASGNRYYYKIDGLMNYWKENENGHLSFYNLPVGKYTLHVKGGDKYGNRFAGEDEILINVIPHWYQTTWFYVLLIATIAMVVYLLVRRRIKTIRKESSLKARIAETEMIALRAQMNPHFIFNCMNIIDGLITENRKKEAKDFLQKFSRLIRLVLENSQLQLVPISSDLKALELYTEMEAIRYNHKFEYTFNIDQELIDENYKIPPLLLQPYVENAIIHGLRHKENGLGKLVVTLKKENEILQATVEDNGVGRKKSEEINQQNNKPHKHIGMQVTNKRIELLKSFNSSKVNLSIKNLNAEDETGTVVNITLPLEFTFE